MVSGKEMTWHNQCTVQYRYWCAYYTYNQVNNLWPISKLACYQKYIFNSKDQALW